MRPAGDGEEERQGEEGVQIHGAEMYRAGRWTGDRAWPARCNRGPRVFAFADALPRSGGKVYGSRATPCPPIEQRARRSRLAKAAQELYSQRFAIKHTIAALRSAECVSV